jgi:hypothetical protein
MTKAKNIYVVQVQGWGDSEDAFYNTGAYTTQALATKAVKQLRAEALADGLDDVVTNIEELALN